MLKQHKPRKTATNKKPRKSKHHVKLVHQSKRTTAARSKPQNKKSHKNLADLNELPLSATPFQMDSPDSPYNYKPVDPDESHSFESYQPPQRHMENEAGEMFPRTVPPPAQTPSPPKSRAEFEAQEANEVQKLEKKLEEIISNIKPAYPSKFFVEPPDAGVISCAISNTETPGDKARKSIVQYFRQASRQSNLSQVSSPVPYLLPIGESSPKTFPIPDYLMHTLYHLSGTTVANYGMGMAAPQYGVNYRMFVIRSELFGVSSAITNIPYILETNDNTHCMVPPRALQKAYPKPPMFEKMALSWDNPNPEFDSHSKPPLNTSKSMVDYHDMLQDEKFLATRPNAIQYHLQKKLTMPVRDEKQLNLCDDRILTQNYSGISELPHYGRPSSKSLENTHKIYPYNSFINEYRGYSVPLADIEREIFTPLLQSFKQQLGSTAIINPRVTAVRYEYFAMREGCFSFPHWHALTSRPIACDVEFETLEIDQAKVPQVISRGTQSSIFLAGSLAQPPGSQMHYCPKSSDSGLDPQFITPEITRQLEISRILPKPEQVKLATRKVTLRDVVSKAFLHEYDHLDGVQFFDRSSGQYLNWQGSARQTKMAPHARFEYPVDIAGAYF